MNYDLAPELLHKPHIRPVAADQIVVLPIYKARETVAGLNMDVRVSEGGVALPDTAEDEPIEGIVVAVGDGHVSDCPTCFPQGKPYHHDLTVGEHILFPIWKCVSVMVDGTEFFILSEEDVGGLGGKIQ